MTQPTPTKIQLINTPDYREDYANSVQVRVNLWDFFLTFGRVNQTAPDSVAIHNFEGIYLSPQQAKALLNILQQNVTQYESAFGEIKLEPQAAAGRCSRDSKRGRPEPPRVAAGDRRGTGTPAAESSCGSGPRPYRPSSPRASR